MSGKLSVAGVALGLWLLTLVLVGGCNLGQPAPTPTAGQPTPVPPSPTAAPVASPTPRPASPSPSPSPSPAASARRPWNTSTTLVIVDPDKGTADAGVRLRTRPALGEDEGAVTLYDGDEVRLVSTTPERVVQPGTNREFYFRNVQVDKGDASVVGKRGWVADDFLRAK